MSRDPRIDAYIAKAQPFARPILEHVRERVHAVLPDVEETVKWSMPAYTVGGKIVLITAAFKAHAALNFWRGQELESSHATVGAMGQFGKIKSLDELPADAELDRLIREAAELAKNAPAPRKAKHAPKPLPELHPDSPPRWTKRRKPKRRSTAFRRAAGANISSGSPKRSRTPRASKRIATAIEWLSEGKRRNWKYENC